MDTSSPPMPAPVVPMPMLGAGRTMVLATCNLNQWAMDFDGNLARIIASIQEAKRQGARFRLGPELEISGYGCEDHFLENDTMLHSWQSLGTLLSTDVTCGILCDVGMAVIYNDVRYNCRVFCLDKRILLVRPKLFLANDGNYREERWFTAWRASRGLETLSLPAEIAAICGQRSVPIGIGIIEAQDALLASETCEELFTPDSPHIALSLAGVDIFANGSGSHHELRKLDKRLQLLTSATAKCGGVYLYANQQGCDGGRTYYDGCALAVVNGDVVAQGSQFSVADVEVVTARICLDDVSSYRAAFMSRSQQASDAPAIPHVRADIRLCDSGAALLPKSAPVAPRIHAPEEEIALGPACWLWDYLRRSGAAGFFLPLSGGADSASTAALVGSMCQLVMAAVRAGDAQVLSDVRRITGGKLPADHRELAGHVMYTCYMGTEHSSEETRSRARDLARDIGTSHVESIIDPLLEAMASKDGRSGVYDMAAASLIGAEAAVQCKPAFKSRGGTWAQDLALQNIQARMRMVLAYMLAQLLPELSERKGWLLVLGSANVDEALRGYYTKYDCSAADINPIGGISKVDLQRFLEWGSHPAPKGLGYATLLAVKNATPTAELQPLSEGAGDIVQSDEADMGMSYAELSRFGTLRKLHRMGPLSMYVQLRREWRSMPAQKVAEKVKHFFKMYSINRHKMTTLTPSYHAEGYGPDDNRFDLRQFLYPTQWTRAFAAIDGMVAADGGMTSKL